MEKNLMNMMNPSAKQNLIDVACGTGDIAKLYLKHASNTSQITCVDPNKGMINIGKEKLHKFKRGRKSSSTRNCKPHVSVITQLYRLLWIKNSQKIPHNTLIINSV